MNKSKYYIDDLEIGEEEDSSGIISFRLDAQGDNLYELIVGAKITSLDENEQTLNESPLLTHDSDYLVKESLLEIQATIEMKLKYK